MMTKRKVLHWVVAVMAGLACYGPELAAQNTPQRPAAQRPATRRPAAQRPPARTAAAQRAGAITALLPTARVVRGAGRAAVTEEARRGYEVLWNDLVRTEKGGRARVTLSDQSILSVGSQAELRIVRHDARTQQTSLQLTYGRVRAEVAARTRQGGRFELRTPTAVAGVIGTHFAADSSVGETTFLCFDNDVEIANVDPSVTGSVICANGMTTTVKEGAPPTPPQPATPEQIQEMLESTEPSLILALSPAAGLAGETLSATASGQNVQGAQAVAVTGEGLAASLQAGATTTTLPLSLVIAGNAAEGPRILTFTRPDDSDMAAIFQVVSTPSGTDKQSYIDAIEKLLAAYLGELESKESSLQQTAGIKLQRIEDLNRISNEPARLEDIERDFQEPQLRFVQTKDASKSDLEQQKAQIIRDFESEFDKALNDLKQRSGSDDPPIDSIFEDETKAAFDKAVNRLKENSRNEDGELETQLAAARKELDGVEQKWETFITEQAKLAGLPPTPVIGPADSTVELGADAAFDGGRSRAAGDASIVSYQWAVCGSAYRPAQFGVVLPATDTACVPLPGFTSTSQEFTIRTCSLEPADYAVRLLVTDSQSRSAAMDARLTVAGPGYDDPQRRLQSLAEAYVALQPQQFLGFFDEVAFSGFTVLQENVRRTFDILNSMDINLRVSQATVNCNEANLRADWQQKYTFDTDPSIVFSQTAQLTVRMQRDPRRGWFITDFQGDNGTVQGLPPGPVVLDLAQPDLELTALVLGGLLATDGGGLATKSLSAGGSSTASVTGVGFGPQTFTATITNVGDADLTQQAVVRFSVLNEAGTQLSSTEVPLPSPLAVGASASVPATLTIPEFATGTNLIIRATVNPGCVVPERNCDARGTFDLAVLAGLANYQPVTIAVNGRTPITGANAIQVGEDVTVTVAVANTGGNSPVGTLTVTIDCDGSGCFPVSVDISAPAAGQTAVAQFPLGPEAFNVVAALNATATVTTSLEEASTADNSLTVPFEIFDFSLAFVSPSPIVPEQNVLIGTPSQVLVQVLQPGVTTELPIDLGADFNASGPPGPVSPNTTAIITLNSPPTLQPGSDTITIHGTNRGVQRTLLQPVRYFNAVFENVSFPLNSPSDPLRIARDTGFTDVTLRLVAGYNTQLGTTALTVLPAAGFTLQLSNTNVNSNEEFELSIEPDLTTQSVVTAITLRGEIPGTFPPVFVDHIVYVLPTGSPDLAVFGIVSPRDLINQPWLVGEALTFGVLVQNQGNAHTAGGETVTLNLNGAAVGSATLPVLAPGEATTLNVKAIAGDDRFRDGSSGTLAAVAGLSRAGDSNTQNNSSSISVEIADWLLSVTGDGTLDVPLSLVAGTPGATQVTIVNAGTGGPVNGSFSLTNGVSSTGLTTVIVTTSLLGPNLLSSAVNVTAALTAPDGEYLAQVIAQIKDGSVVTAERQATIHVRVGSGQPAAVVTLTSSAGNTDSTNPLQLNGPLAEEIRLTPLCDGGQCSGTLDLQFTDGFNVGAQPQQIRSAAFGSPQPVRFRGASDGAGQMITGFGSVTASATAVQVDSGQFSALTSPDPTGSQITDLYFSVGDLGANMSTCVQVPLAGNGGLRVDFFPISGFNASSLSWTWTGLPAGVSVTPPSGSTAFDGQSYPGTDFLFSNTAATDQLAEVLLAVSISNSLGSATKTFPVVLVLSDQSDCSGFSGLRLPGGVPGTWSQGASGGGSFSLMTLRQSSRTAPSSSLPDVQVSSGDISYSPSVPMAGDTVDVRFRLRNAGDADALEVPVGLRVGGVIVASDTFDVRAGSTTLAALQWSNARLAEFRGVRSASGASQFEKAGWEQHPGAMQVAVVIDPYNATRQKSSNGKTALLSRFVLRESGVAGPAVGGRAERVLLELDEGACVGFRFTSGAGATCTSADVEMTVVDLGQGRYTIAAHRGVADLGRIGLGSALPEASLLRYASDAVLVPGHTYAVQLPGERMATFTVQGIRSPMQLEMRARQVFGRSARGAAIGESTDGPADTGEVSGSSVRLREAKVYLDIVYHAH